MHLLRHIKILAKVLTFVHNKVRRIYMPKSIIVGSARSRPGSLQCGRWEAFRHPTGQAEFLPVVIAQGIEDGPCIWLTAGIHGPEHAGPLVLHRLLTEDLVKGLRGTIVAIPALNPVGLRTKTRKPPPDEKDPNRLWPDGKPEKPLGLDEDPPTPLEVTYKKLFARMLTSADYHIDYHNAWTGSLSFAFQDRMLYRQDADGKDKADAEALVARQVEMLRAYGHTVICEMPSATMIDEDLQRPFEGQQTGFAFHQCQHIDTEGRLQLRVFEQTVQHAFGLGIAFKLDNDAHAVAVGFVAQV